MLHMCCLCSTSQQPYEIITINLISVKMWKIRLREVLSYMSYSY